MKRLYPLVVLMFLASCNTDVAEEQSAKNRDSITAQQISENGDSLAHANIPQDSASTGIPADSLDNEIRMENGVRIQHLRKGNGAGISEGEVVVMHYEKRILDGKAFDSSKKLGKPVGVMTGLSSILDAFSSALTELRVGDSVRIVIPSSEAYGEKGYPPIIPANADLEYYVGIERKAKPQDLGDGLKIHRFEEGNGIEVEDGSLVTIQYFAFLEGGSMYDASPKRGSAYTVKVGDDNVIPGLQLALEELRQGDWAYIRIPSIMAYGAKGLPDLVPANTNVVYLVEVVKVE